MSTAFGGVGDIITQIRQGIRDPSTSANFFLQRFLNVGIGLLLNGSIQVDQLQTLPRATLYSPELLICDFSGPCYWYSEGISGNAWKWVPNLPDTLQVLSATQTLALPSRPPFVFLHVSGSPGDNLVSAKIKCQRDKGILQFHYWKTNEVAIRVCQMDEYGFHPYYCTDLKLTDVAGVAIAILPEQLEPFKIAISSVGEGFISIDSIRFVGTFCGEHESVTTEPITTTTLATTTQPGPDPLLTGPTAEERISTRAAPEDGRIERRQSDFIADASQLICDSFNSSSQWPCRWGSGSASPFMPISTVAGLEGTIAANQTSLPAAIHFFSGQPTIENQLTSDPIWCQNGSGQLMLKYWATAGAGLQVCTSEFITGEPIYCSRPLNRSHPDYPGPVAVQLMGAIDQPFEIKIFAVYPEAESADLIGSDSLEFFEYVVIDDLAYFADVCQPPKLETNRETSVAVMTSTISSSSSSSRPHPQLITAAWVNESSESDSDVNSTAALLKATASVEADSSESIFARRGWPTNELVDPVMPWGAGPDSFWHKQASLLALSSTTTTSTTTTTTAATTTPPLLISHRSAHLLKCSRLNCDFEDGYCGYTQGTFLLTTFWSRRNASFGRPLSRLTDVQTSALTGSYLGALLKRNSVYANAVIESPEFVINRISYLRFHVYSAGLSTALRVCFDSQLDEPIQGRRYLSTLRRCRDVLKDVPVINLRKWNAVRVLMIPGFTKFFIVAQHSGTANEYVAVGVDNITVTPCELHN